MPDPTAQTPPAAGWSWRDDPDVVSWDWRQGPDLDELRQALARHGVTLTEVDTSTGDVAVRIGSTPVEVMEDALCRRVWATALRWWADSAGRSPHPSTVADQIEAGTLSPWEQSPAADPPSMAVEPQAAPGAGTDTPEAATAAYGPGSGFPHVAGRCPACRWASLFLGAGGHVTCSRLDCPDPARADQLLHGELRREDTPEAADRDAALHEALQEDAEMDAEHRAEEAAEEPLSGAEGLILGRALLDADGDVWPQSGPNTWRVPSGKSRYGQQEVEVVAVEPPAREVLLVPVEAGPVLEAALRWTRAWDADPFGPATSAAKARLAAAVDAATSRTGAHEEHDGGMTAEPCPACLGRRWVDDENWQPEDYERAQGRTVGAGLIPCGACNEGGWLAPDHAEHACVLVADHTEHACGCGHTWTSPWDDSGTVPVWSGPCDARHPARPAEGAPEPAWQPCTDPRCHWCGEPAVEHHAPPTPEPDWESRIRAQHPAMDDSVVQRAAYALKVLSGDEKPAGDVLRAHLRARHYNEAAQGLTDRQAIEQHRYEHTGPGTIRNHPPDDLSVESAPEPAGDGPGWERDTITELVAAARTPVHGVEPILTRDDADQLEALRTERDHLVVVKLPRLARAAASAESERDAARAEADRWVERHARAVAELAEVTADRDRASKLVTHAEQQWERAQEETTGVREELERMTGDLQDRETDIGFLRAELKRVRTEHLASCVWIDPGRQSGQPCLGGTRIPARNIAGLLDDGLDLYQIRQSYPDVQPGHLAAVRAWAMELAIARRDGVADTLEWASDQPLSHGRLRQWAAEVRAGEREIPTRQDGDSDG